MFQTSKPRLGRGHHAFTHGRYVYIPLKQLQYTEKKSAGTTPFLLVVETISINTNESSHDDDDAADDDDDDEWNDDAHVNRDDEPPPCRWTTCSDDDDVWKWKWEKDAN